MNKTNNQIEYITILNVLACISVIALHCNGVFWQRPDGMLWISANFIETFFYFAVPIFFMLPGVTLFNYREKYSTKEYFIKRSKKLIIPFLVWSLIGFVFLNRFEIINGNVSLNLVTILNHILNAKDISIYWFFPAMISIYLCIPLLSMVENKKEIFIYASIIGVVFKSILPFIASLTSFELNWELIPSVINGYVLYSIIGYTLGNTNIDTKKRWIIYICGIIGWLLHFVGTVVCSAPGEINSSFKGYLNLPAVMQACAVFVFIKYNAFSFKPAMKILTWFSNRTFGVYLIHIYFIWGMPKLLHMDSAGMLWRSAGVIFIFVICSVIVAIMQKVPFVKRIVP